MKNLIKLGALVAGLISTAAFATPVYNYNIDDPSGNPNGGRITNINTTYDADNSIFSWQATTLQKNGNFTDGFWLVVSDGPNPKASGGEYAALCGDLDTGRLNLFAYNGQNNNSSCNNNAAGFLDSFGAGFIDVTDSGSSRTFSFSLDVSGINSAFNTADWDGISFDDTIGIWFHTTIGSNFTYNAQGQLSHFGFAHQGWHDSSNQTTTSVPAPAPLVLMLLALPMLFKRKK